MTETSPWGIVTNNLYTRLVENDVDGFNSLVWERWKLLRTRELKFENLLAMVEKYHQQLVASGVQARELDRWEGANMDLDHELAYIKEWIEKRLLYLDELFEEAVMEDD